MPPKKKQRTTVTSATTIITRKGLRSSGTSTSSIASPSQSSTTGDTDMDTGDVDTTWTQQARTSTTDTMMSALTIKTTVYQSNNQVEPIDEFRSSHLDESNTNVEQLKTETTKLEHTNVEQLKTETTKLEQAFMEGGPTLGKLRHEREAQLKEILGGTELMLLITKSFPDSGTTTSESANPGSQAVVIDTESNTQKKEENLPEDKSRWMVHQGEATLIYNDRNHILNEACRRGSLEIVEDLLASGADINNRSIDGLTPVMIAAWTGNKQLFDLLVKLKSDLSLMLENGNNIFHVAGFGRNRDIVDFIASNKIADIESKGMHGRTAVMKSAMFGEKEIFEFLVSRGSDLSVIDDYGSNILHLACFWDDPEIVLYLISQNVADIESRGRYGRTPVLFAAEKGTKMVFDLLVSRGCDLSAVGDDGNNALHLVSLSGNVEIVEYLVSNQIADIDCKGEFGRTPVMDAAVFGQQQMFDVLVSKDSDLLLKDDDGNNILHLACMSDNVEIVQYLMSQEIADIDSEGEYRRTPVMYAAMEGHKNVFNVLVSKGCDLSVVDDFGNTVLHLACCGDNVEIVQYLISHQSASLERKNQSGQTAVMLVAEKGLKKVFDFLVGKGCNLCLTDHKGNNILHNAAIGGNISITENILSQGIIDINCRNHRGRLASETARRFNHNKVAHILEARRLPDN